MVPFTVYQKHEKRNTWDQRITFVRYVQIDAYNVSARLLKDYAITINGAPVKSPFSSGGINIYFAGGNVVYATDFGLTVYWDGRQRYNLYLCSAYGGYVCGLCGNADGY